MPARPSLRIVMTSVGDEPAARKLARRLVEKRAAACVSIVPLAASVYRWQQRVVEESEFLLLVKTTVEAEPRVREILEAEHPYKLPEIITISGEASEPYWAWASSETQTMES